MKDTLTVYFDTCFYSWLANATETDAEHSISRLNALRVRHVVSGQVLYELLSNSRKPNLDDILVKRMKSFEIEPYTISNNPFDESLTTDQLRWEVLLLKGEVRNALADFFKSLFDLSTKAECWSLSAHAKYDDESQEQIKESLAPFLASLGFTKTETYTFEEAAEKYLEFTSELYSNIFHLLTKQQQQIFRQIDFSAEPTADNVFHIVKQLNQVIGENNVQRLREADSISQSTTKSDNRPFKVIVGDASVNELRRLGNTLRDSNHVLLFLLHQNEVNLLQVDAAQKNQMTNSATHRFVELNLAQRCFASNSLANTIEIIRNKKAELSI